MFWRPTIKRIILIGTVVLAAVIFLLTISCQGWQPVPETYIPAYIMDERVQANERELYTRMVQGWIEEEKARESKEKFLVNMYISSDYGLALYRTDEYRQRVIDFYAHEVASERIARLILENAALNEIPLSLAFALAWAESGYNPDDVSHNRHSVDRGLFQLNSLSFPEVDEADFFDPAVSAKLGLAYLRWCLNAGESEIVALAMYNAGRTRVSTGGTPLMTLEYISKIIEYRTDLDERFNAACLKDKNPRTVEKAKANTVPVIDRKKGIK